MILDKAQVTIENSTTCIAFKTEDEEESPPGWGWGRYITINGKKAYQIGTPFCGTCRFFFERLKEFDNTTYTQIIDHANESIASLNKGITNLENNIIDTLKPIIPNGHYYILLSTVIPKLVYPGKPGDYFFEEQLDFIPSNYVHNPRTEYYRGHNGTTADNDLFFEFLAPLFSSQFLQQDRIEYYKKMIVQGDMPTAIALSVLDMHTPPDVEHNHACLTHYLIDGHHKMYAAATLGKPLTVLSFLATNEGKLSGQEEINQCIELLQNLTP